MLGYHSETSEHSLYSIASSQLSETVVYANVTVERTTPIFTRPELWFRGPRLIDFIYSALRLPNGVQICSTPSLPVTNLCSQRWFCGSEPKKTSAGPKRTPSQCECRSGSYIRSVYDIYIYKYMMKYMYIYIYYICRCTWLLNQEFWVTAFKYKSRSSDGFSTRFRAPSNMLSSLTI